MDTANHTWANYFLCAYKGVHEEAGRASADMGMEVMISGNVPRGSGLSSSSALICASAIAIMAALGLSFSKERVASFACTCERYVGVLSGGMDQAISILGEAGVAKYVTFNPVRVRSVHLPAVTFVIANSMAVSEKAVSATDCYNARVLECRIAAVVLAISLLRKRSHGTALDDAIVADVRRDVRTLADVETGFTSRSRSAADEAVGELIHGGTYSVDEVEEIIRCPLEAFCEGSKPQLDVLEVKATPIIRIELPPYVPNTVLGRSRDG